MEELSVDFVFAFSCIYCVVMTRSISSVFCEHQLKFCKILEKCGIFADVHYGRPLRG